MSLFERIKNWISRDREVLVIEAIPPQRVVGGGAGVTAVRPVANAHYIRLTVARAFLSKKTEWFADVHPMIQSVVRLKAGGKPTELAQVHDSSRIGGAVVDGDVTARNLRLTPWLPFRGDDIELHVGLVAIPSKSGLQVVAKVLAGFADVVATPPLDAAFKVAGPLMEGIGTLADAGQPSMRLGLLDTYDKTSFVDGYLAVVRASSADVVPSTLRVIDGELCVEDAKGQRALTGCDWLLLRFEVDDARDDWEALTGIDRPYHDALSAAERGDRKRAEVMLSDALSAAYRAPELTEAHRRIIVDGMKAAVAERLDPPAGTLSGLAERSVELKQLVAAADVDDAVKHPLMSLDDVFADWPF